MKGDRMYPLITPTWEKSLDSASAVDGAKCTVTATIITADPDREGDVMIPMGCKLDWFARNPVVLLEHGRNYPLPIGNAADEDGNLLVNVGAESVVATTRFCQSDKFAMQVFNLYAEGLMRGWSAGFQPLKGGAKSLGRNAVTNKECFQFNDYAMFEYSATPKPVNPEAMTIAVEKAMIGGEVMHPVLKCLMQPIADSMPRKSWSNGIEFMNIERGKAMEDKKDDDKKDEMKPGETKMSDTPADDDKKGEIDKDDVVADEAKPLKPSAAALMQTVQHIRDLKGELLTMLDGIDNGPAADAIQAIADAIGEHESIIADAMAAGEYGEMPEAVDDEGLKAACYQRKNAASPDDAAAGVVKSKSWKFVPRRLSVVEKSAGPVAVKMTAKERLAEHAEKARLEKEIKNLSRTIRAGRKG